MVVLATQNSASKSANMTGVSTLTVRGIDPEVLHNKPKFISLARQGISGDIVKNVVDIVGHKDLFVAMLDTTSSNFSRIYRKKKLSAAQSESVLDTYRVFAFAAEVFGHDENAQEWMDTKIPALGDQSPVSLCDTFEGREMVLAALRKIQTGEFV
jgi:putative toxin-antitoxin system antitoxin component (TIGR02293 family)